MCTLKKKKTLSNNIMCIVSSPVERTEKEKKKEKHISSNTIIIYAKDANKIYLCHHIVRLKFKWIRDPKIYTYENVHEFVKINKEIFIKCIL